MDIMKEKVNVKQYLKGTPRPHYLIKEAIVEKISDKQYKIIGVVNFDSSKAYSVEDRKQMEWSHVNLGDCAFAFWNGGHVLSEWMGYSNKILRKKVAFDVGNQMIIPDKDMSMELYANVEGDVNVRGVNFEKGTLVGKIVQDGKKVMGVEAPFFAEKKDTEFR